MRDKVLDVVVFTGIPKVLTYAVGQEEDIEPGVRVVVPVKSALRVGLVISRHTGPLPSGIRYVHKVLDRRPLVTGDMMDILRWCSRYYHVNIGSCISLAFPPYLRKARSLEYEPLLRVYRTGLEVGRLGSKQRLILNEIPENGIGLEQLKKRFPRSTASLKGLINKGLVALGRDIGVDVETATQMGLDYTPYQKKAIGEISRAIDDRNYSVFLLHGITGSGKTEVYLACALHALAAGRQVLYMVPEIALTPQTICRIRQRIPYEIAIFHSALGERQRAREFLKVAMGDARFVLGTRSAIFAPLDDIGLVIVDEEHDRSYKQEEGVPYNARDLGLLRAKAKDSVVILGSATPSIDTYVKKERPEFKLIEMPERIGKASLPEVEVVDMRGRDTLISEELYQELKKTLSRGEQSLLFLNRRGFASAVICPACGKVFNCPHCDRPLTYHKARSMIICHYCGFSEKLPEICPSCGCLDIKRVGMGTERIVEEVKAILPGGTRVLKMDTDEITTTSRLNNALDAISQGKVDVIVGTQMISKGHDFPNLTLVGVMHAEQMLYMPDFRATERTFQQITQVAGRAGRRRSCTKVIIQTLIPDHTIINAIKSYDYLGMLEKERSIRRAMGFPPYTYMARCILSSYKKDEPRMVAMAIRDNVEAKGCRVMGPAPAPIPRLRGMNRWHIIVTSTSRKALHNFVDKAQAFRIPSYVRLKIDIDPYDML